MNNEKKLITKYLFLRQIYQMNPTKFVYDMLKRIEKRNNVKTMKNSIGQEVVYHGVTDGEYQTIDLFKRGELNPRSYGTKNEEIQRSVNEGLNLPKKQIPIKDITKGKNSDVVNHFFSDNINRNIVKWGTLNLKIVKYPNGFGLMNYKTLLAWRSFADNITINNQKYSSSTTKIQSGIRMEAHYSNLPVTYVNEDEIYDIAGIPNETKHYPYEDRGRVWNEQERKDNIKQILRNEHRNV